MNKINIFIKKEFILIFILFIVFINPFFYGYRVAILFIIFILFKVDFFLNNIDRNVIYLFLFTLSYELISALLYNNEDYGVITLIPNIFVPSLLYLVGKYVSINYKKPNIWLFFLFYLSFVFSIIPMISILIQIQENGFEGSRSMYLIWDKNLVLNATGLASYLTLNIASIGLINAKKVTKLERIVSIGIVVVFLFSLVCVLRLGSRTQLVLGIVSLIGSFMLNLKHNTFLKNLIFIVCLSFLISYIIINFNENFDLIKFYTDRLDDQESSIGSAGGRSDRWLGALESVITDPFGWELKRFGYAHNLWLDVARVSGIISLLFLILFTLSSIKTWIKSLKILKKELFLRNYIFMYFVNIILIFNVEPIMDGCYLLFLLFCMFVGLLSGIASKSLIN
jgi:hypothetical protein